MPSAVATMIRFPRWSKSTLLSVFGADRRDGPEHHEAGAAEHRQRDGGDDRAEDREQAEHDHDPAGGRDHPAALDAAQGDEADVLGVGGVRERVEDAAERGGEAVRAQAADDRLLVGLLADDLADGDQVARRLDHRHDHHDHHRDHDAEGEGGRAEVERRRDAEDVGVADAAEVREPERDRDQRADDDPDHDRRALDPLVGEALQQQDEDQHADGEREVVRDAVVGSWTEDVARAQSTATGSSEMPISRITVPTTSGGKKRRSLPITGASSTAMMPAMMIAPNTSVSPCPLTGGGDDRPDGRERAALHDRQPRAELPHADAGQHRRDAARVKMSAAISTAMSPGDT